MFSPVFILLVFVAVILLIAVAVSTVKLIRARKTKSNISSKIITLLVLVLLSALVIAVMATGVKYEVPEGKVLVTDNQDVFRKDVYHIYTEHSPDLIEMKHSLKDIRISVRSKEFDEFFLLVQGTAWWDKLDKDKVAVFQSNYPGFGIKESLDVFLDWGFEREITKKANTCGDEISTDIFPRKIENCLNYFLNLDNEEIGMDRFDVKVKVVSEENYEKPKYRSTIEDCYEDAEITVCRESKYK